MSQAGVAPDLAEELSSLKRVTASWLPGLHQLMDQVLIGRLIGLAAVVGTGKSVPPCAAYTATQCALTCKGCKVSNHVHYGMQPVMQVWCAV